MGIVYNADHTSEWVVITATSVPSNAVIVQYIKQEILLSFLLLAPRASDRSHSLQENTHRPDFSGFHLLAATFNPVPTGYDQEILVDI